MTKTNVKSDTIVSMVSRDTLSDGGLKGYLKPTIR